MAVRIALDSNAYSALARGNRATRRVVEEADEVWLPFIVLAELRAGFALGRKQTINEQVLRHFLTKPGVGVLYPGDSTTRRYARLFRQLRLAGRPIPTNDIWIAALADEHGLVLVTGDGHFTHLPQLVLIHPADDETADG